MNANQRWFLAMLRDDARREIYESAAPGGKYGSGRFYVTYSGDEKPYEPLSQAEVDEMVRLEYISKGSFGFKLRDPEK